MGSQTTTQNSAQTGSSTLKPYGAVGKQINTGLADAGSIYDRLNKQWGSMDRMSDAGLAGFNDLARGTPNLASSAIGNLNSILARNGLTGIQTATRDASRDLGNAATRLGGMATNNPALSGFQELSGYQGPSYSERNLSGIASGDYLNREDPNFERLLSRATANAATEAGMAAAGMGRSGSPYHQASVAQTVGDLEAGQRVAQYDRERQAQVQANQLMDSTRQGDVSARLAALSGLGGTYATGIGQALQGNAQGLGAYGQAFNMAQQGVGNNLGMGSGFSSLYGAAQQPNTDLFSMRGYPTQDINSFLSLGGYGQPYGTQTSTQTGTQNTQQPINWAGLIGGGLLGGASLLRGVF